MPIIRNANAIWNGDGHNGTGHLTSDSKVLDNTQYSFHTRFGDGIGTNPEELIAAAHAGCFSMKLAFNLQGEGFVADEINTNCKIIMDDGKITNSKITLNAKVPNISSEKFEELVRDAEKNCPISKLLNTEISVEYTLI